MPRQAEPEGTLHAVPEALTAYLVARQQLRNLARRRLSTRQPEILGIDTAPQRWYKFIAIPLLKERRVGRQEEPMSSPLSTPQLDNLLPALPLLAQDIGCLIAPKTQVLDRILRAVGVPSEEWARQELALWGKILQRATDASTTEYKTVLEGELRDRGIPEASATLAVDAAIPAPLRVWPDRSDSHAPRAEFLVEFRMHGYARRYARETVYSVARKFGVGGITKERVVPHVSLYGPGVTHDITSVVSTVERIGRNYRLVPFTVDGFGFFNKCPKTIFLDISASRQLRDLRWDLSQELIKVSTCQPWDRVRDFAFHATIAFKDVDRQFDRIWSYLEHRGKPHIHQYLLRACEEIANPAQWKGSIEREVI